MKNKEKFDKKIEKTKNYKYMCNKCGNKNRTKGVTLIALMVTVIVLLILAVISIQMLTGNEILKQTINAKKNYEKSSWNEVVQMITSSWNIEKISNPNENIEEYLNTEFKRYNENTVIKPYNGDFIIICGENKVWLDEKLRSHNIIEGDSTKWIWTLNVDDTITLQDNIEKDTIKDLVIPNMIDGRIVKDIKGGIFRDCTNINSLNISYGLKEIGSYEFYGCTNISGDIEIPSSITSLGVASFYNCSSIKNLTLDCNAVIRYNSGIATFEKCTSLENVTITKNVKRIEGYTFRNSNINGKMTIECSGEIAGGAFRDMTGNGTIELKGENITSIDSTAFYNNNLLKKVYLSNKCTNIGDYAFYMCNNLEEVYLDCDSDIGNWCFAYNTKLKNVIISNNIKNIGEYAFEGANIQETIKCANKGVIKTRSFGNLSGSGKMIYDFSNVIEIKDFAFNGNLIEFENVKITKNTETLGIACFEGCSNLKNLYIDCKIIPDSGEAAHATFRNCSNLKNVYIGSNTKYIGQQAFAGCSNIENVYYSGNEAEWNELKKYIGIYNNYLLNANIYYNYSK